MSKQQVSLLFDPGAKDVKPAKCDVISFLCATRFGSQAKSIAFRSMFTLLSVPDENESRIRSKMLSALAVASNLGKARNQHQSTRASRLSSLRRGANGSFESFLHKLRQADARQTQYSSLISRASFSSTTNVASSPLLDLSQLPPRSKCNHPLALSERPLLTRPLLHSLSNSLTTISTCIDLQRNHRYAPALKTAERHADHEHTRGLWRPQYRPYRRLMVIEIMLM